jgi:hypothetical protein
LDLPAILMCLPVRVKTVMVENILWPSESPGICVRSDLYSTRHFYTSNECVWPHYNYSGAFKDNQVGASCVEWRKFPDMFSRYSLLLSSTLYANEYSWISLTKLH